MRKEGRRGWIHRRSSPTAASVHPFQLNGPAPSEPPDAPPSPPSADLSPPPGLFDKFIAACIEWRDSWCHATSRLITDEYVICGEQAISLPARSEVTAWLPVPLALKTATDPVLVDRLSARPGVTDIAVAGSLASPDDAGLVPVRLINEEHHTKTIPASSPVARCLISYEMRPAWCLDLSSEDPYHRLDVDQRASIDSEKLRIGRPRLHVHPRGTATGRSTRSCKSCCN